MVALSLPTLRRPADVPITVSINGRAVSLVLRVRPMAPAPELAGYLVPRDENPPVFILTGAPAEVSAGWWIELFTGSGAPMLGAVRLVAGADIWAAHNAYLRTTVGAHLLLSCNATPSGLRPLSGQCEIDLTPAALT